MSRMIKFQQSNLWNLVFCYLDFFKKYFTIDTKYVKKIIYFIKNTYIEKLIKTAVSLCNKVSQTFQLLSSQRIKKRNAFAFLMIAFGKINSQSERVIKSTIAPIQHLLNQKLVYSGTILCLFRNYHLCGLCAQYQPCCNSSKVGNDKAYVYFIFLFRTNQN